MEIKRESNFFELYDYHIIEGNKKLSIYMGPDCRLHFLLKNSMNEKSLEESFFIRKDNPSLYALFLEAYENIIKVNIYEPKEEEISSCQTLEDSLLLKEVTQEQNALIKELCLNAYRKVVKSDVVTWTSEIDDSICFTIEKQKDAFQLIFKKCLTKNKRRDFIGGRECLDVIVGIQDSHFFPFNLAFVKLYRNLQFLGLEYCGEIKHDLYLINEKKGTN